MNADVTTGEMTYVPVFTWDAGVHPAADLFPMLDPEAFTKLVWDIEKHGQRDPIWLDADGQLIDGRNRLAACQLIKVEPLTRTYNGDAPTELVLSLNVHRRQLTPAQMTAVAVDALPMIEEEAEKRRLANLRQGADVPEGACGPPRESGKSSDLAAAAVGVGGRTVRRLKRVKEQSVETFEQVRNGEKSINQAEREVVPRFKSDAMNKLEKAKANNPSPDRSRDAVAERVAKAKEMAAQGYTSRQIAPAIGIDLKNFSEFRSRHGVEVPADKVTGKTRHHDANRIVGETVSTLEGLVIGIGLADVSELNPDEVEGWVASFTESIKALTKFRNKMKETTS